MEAQPQPRTEKAPRPAAEPVPWQVRVRWGDRRLASELVDGTRRPQLVVGDQDGDDVALGQGRITFHWRDGGLTVAFSPGVTGWLQQRGDWATSLSELVTKGAVQDDGAQWTVQLAPGDVLQLKAGTLTIDARQSKSRPRRLPFDPQYLWLAVLALIAVGLIAAAVWTPHSGVRPSWLPRPEPEKPRPVQLRPN